MNSYVYMSLQRFRQVKIAKFFEAPGGALRDMVFGNRITDSFMLIEIIIGEEDYRAARDHILNISNRSFQVI